MKRRSFLRLLTLPMLAFVPKPAPAPELRRDLTYSDSEGTAPADLDVLNDDDLTNGIEYQP